MIYEYFLGITFNLTRALQALLAGSKQAWIGFRVFAYWIHCYGTGFQASEVLLRVSGHLYPNIAYIYTLVMGFLSSLHGHEPVITTGKSWVIIILNF